MPQQAPHSVPGDVGSLRATTQPLAPRANDPVVEVVQRWGISGETEIPVVPEQLPPKCNPLFAHRLMPLIPAPVSDALECPLEAVSRSLLLHHPVSLAGFRPVVSKAQQVEATGPTERHCPHAMRLGCPVAGSRPV